MKRIFLTSILFAFLFNLNAQDLKRVHPVFIEIESKNPDKYTYGDDQVLIKFLNIESGIFKIEFTNMTNNTIEFNRKKTYTLIDGKSNDTYIGLERDNAATYLKNEYIPKGASASTLLFAGSFFDFMQAKKFYKQHNKPKHNILVLVFNIDGEEKEIKLDFSIYPKKLSSNK